MRPLLLVALAWALSLAAGAESAPTTADWEAARTKILSAEDYSFTYQYRGPEGEFSIRYAYRSPGVLRSEILEGKHSGTVILYDPSRSKDFVVVDSGFLRLRRSTSSKDIAGTSLVTPLYQQILGYLEGAEPQPPRLEEGRPVFEFRSPDLTHLAVLDPSHNLVRYVQMRKSKCVQEFNFQDIRWNTGEQLQLCRPRPLSLLWTPSASPKT